MRVSTVFIDESGGLGFGNGSSRHITISALVTTNPDKVERIPLAIRKRRLKKSLLRKPELKFHDTSPEIRRVLLEKLMALGDISIAAIVTNKAGISDRLRQDQESFYDRICAQLLVKIMEAEGIHRRFVVVFDARPHNRPPSYDFWTRVGCIVDTELSRRGFRSPNLSISTIDSRNSGGLQVADFIAGAIQRRFERGDSSYYDLIAPAVVFIDRLF